MFFIVIVLCAVSFCMGYCLSNRNFSNVEMFEVTKPIEIQVSPNKKGELPIGLKMYKYRELPEITTYYIFVNLKERSVLLPLGLSGGLIDPVDAYPVEE